MTHFTGLDVLDANGLRPNQSLDIIDNRISAMRPARPGDTGTNLSRNGKRALICPGFIDLQVNGGGGLMLAECHTTQDVSRLAAAHLPGGTLGVLPTLISDTPRTVERVIALVAEAARTDTAVLGLHLEGPHLGVVGAHDPAHLRPMTDNDVTTYRDAAKALPHLMITLAPEQVTPAQIATLTEAGVIVSLGHSACDYDHAIASFKAGARGATHLFNAMSGLHHRAPGLVGAALDRATFIGLIADGRHVHPSAIRTAFRARTDAIHLISDAMACAGTDATSFALAGRTVHRRDGNLTLADGTLAGADLSMIDAVSHMAEMTGRSFDEIALLAFDTPHRILTGTPATIEVDTTARLLCLHNGRLSATWLGGDWTPV